MARRAGPQVNWDSVRDAPRQAVEDAIQPGGLHRQKSARIQEILRAGSSDLGEAPSTGARDASPADGVAGAAAAGLLDSIPPLFL